MTTIKDKYAIILTETERIIGNVKGGIKMPVQAAEEIHAMYASFIQTEIRYPSEPPIYVKQETQEDSDLIQIYSKS